MVARRGVRTIHQRHGVAPRSPAAPRGHQPSLRRRAGRARHQSRYRRRRARGAARAVGLRQVHAAAHRLRVHSPERRRVLFDGEPVDHLPPSRRGAGIVFQNYALFPHMTVAENVAYGLEAQKWPRRRIAPRVAEMLALVHMSEFAARQPRQLSGGQQQRVALARCLATDPKVLLLDEPFGALDKNLRLDMQIEVKRLQREYGITTILVTHDQEEALSMADRIAVMNRGRIEQVSSPTDVYDRPQTVFVNQFVGTTNLLHDELADDLRGLVRLEGGALMMAAPAPGLRQGDRVV